MRKFTLNIFTLSLGLAVMPMVEAAPTAQQQLLEQVRLGEATHREDLVQQSLYRLELIDPNNPDVVAARFRSLLRQGDIDGAQKQLDRLSQLAPSSNAYKSSRTTMLLSTSDGRQALQQARLQATTGHAEEAVASYNKLFNGAPPEGDLIAAINKGCHTVAALKAETKAGTGCGGCIPLVTQVLNAELAKQGIEVNNNLCEHFAYSRQELFHLIRVEGIKTFEELLAKHGKGYGCEVCKPTVGSLLASCWNEYILKPEHTPLQDSNDNFLANIQKDGTYSVIPRSPGGEITPEGLMAVGRIAREFNLYTKITGSQRLAMFGAQKDDLPEIWRQLIEAGFETGHAYAKALRMAKTCVGSTWCRYGVGDSVGLGVELENRYKGIRTPHKMKFGVSGCTRECSEAQGKDVGIIATEKGWNLYVCGNGGMKPRHANLLAADIDRETLIKYLDRFMMFYIRTADKLTRTAPWLENLEGGIDYLKAVIIDDKLGLNAHLEEEMARLREAVVCEWTETVNTPSAQTRFKHFINSDKRDPNVQMVPEREQHRPATPYERIPVTLVEDNA
ncbi:nitrite reductase large subunit NirB [Escherichia coli]|uniref:nitrite reductase large subunit NirB n=1 Tax=Escherichia coli TaxID=562 RepID=UPI0025994E01|nr:nitrite reductase large subunit NirB [Escherichia coli]MDM4050922.1 nitrite reductase large subunit NirB [Escherichia coli]